MSTTDDATGTWNRYAFDIGSQFGVNFYDYPKLSVWPDAYYLSFNVFDASGSSFLGPQPFALDRSAMLAGQPAPWLAVSPAEFDVPVGATVSTTVTLSATTADGVTQPGTDSAQILVSTNTPQSFNPVGVTMNVTPPNGWGKLAGTLSGTDCSGKTNPLKGVVFATGKSYSFTLKTDAKGSYAFWAPSAANPVTLTASASGWIAQNQKVNIRIAKTTTVNFTLRPVTC